MTPLASAASDLARRHRRVALSCAAFVALMVGAAFASVPLYDLFCRTTGFGGATVTSDYAPARVIDREFEVGFDSNVNGGLDWVFKPEAPTVTLKGGEVRTVYYTITNNGSTPSWGIASYNVTPAVMGGYFTKIQCFCFTEQMLKPGETREMQVVFFVDPAIAEDKNADGVRHVTLSYTFFPAKPPATPVASAKTGVQPTL